MTTYIYNKVKESMRAVMFLSLGSVLFTGCGDFLDILPTDKVVLENYWKEKQDVTSAVNACYEALADEQVVTRMGVWGELRSDNVVAGSNTPNEINEMLKENLLPSNPMCSWAGFYNVINRCNIVCHYAPAVADAANGGDPNYSKDELDATIAEATALRALSYFYLIRTFRDVPYTKEPSIDDNQNYFLPATPFEQVLDSLIADLEVVKDNALRRYELERVNNKHVTVPANNSSRITRWAIYTLLADLYLWKGDWDNVILYCDKVIDYKTEVYNELMKQDQLNDIELYDGIPMLLESLKGSNAYSVGNAYTAIFGDGNSFESIFELSYNGNSKQENNWVGNYYGTSNTPRGRLRASSLLMEGFSDDKGQVFLTQRDCRAYEGLRSEGSNYTIAKYLRQSASFSLQKLGSVSVPDNLRARKNANWIIYRLSDVLLMKAEALIERGGEGDYDEAFKLINVVYKRATAVSPDATTGGLAYDKYSGSKQQMEDLLFEERQREFLFEGKRWFDLVRLSRREGETTRLVSLVIRKQQQDVNVIKIKLTDPNYIYFPYAKSELKANPLLKQNPAFNNGEESMLK